MCQVIFFTKMGYTCSDSPTIRFFITPHHWPIQAYEPTLSPQLQKKIKAKNNPVAYWPSPPVIASHKVTTTA